MWCTGALTQECRERMYALLELYATHAQNGTPHLH